MRIKNKEIRRRRQRKEQVIKAAQRADRVKWANKPAPAVEAKPAAKASVKTTAPKPAAKGPVQKSAPAKKTAAPKAEPKVEGTESVVAEAATVEAKPKKAPAKKKAEA